MCELVVKWRDVEKACVSKACFSPGITGPKEINVFNNKNTLNQVIMERVNKLFEEYGKYAAYIYRSPLVPYLRSPRVWEAPANEVIKMNVDASLVVDGCVVLGIVARDFHGNILF